MGGGSRSQNRTRALRLVFLGVAHWAHVTYATLRAVLRRGAGSKIAEREIPLRYFGAGSRSRTGTVLSYHGILSPGRLPIPPFRHNFVTV